MKTMQVREAKAQFSSMLEAAERGEPTTITRNGHPTAVVVSVADAKRIFRDRPSMIAHLLAFPGGVELTRDHRPTRQFDL